jgi:hypothetical protein
MSIDYKQFILDAVIQDGSVTVAGPFLRNGFTGEDLHVWLAEHDLRLCMMYGTNGMGSDEWVILKRCPQTLTSSIS